MKTDCAGEETSYKTLSCSECEGHK